MIFHDSLLDLRSQLEGELFFDEITRILYATDASAYREKPLAVAYPKTKLDIITLISFANTHRITLIPRGAGTSLAGQVVGKGIIVDVSKYLTKIIEINPDEHWVRVQPGVVLDELNLLLEAYGLFFAPETSTSNRCMIGGMIGNNSCGSHSLIYGGTRDHLLEVTALLSDGNEVVFNDLNNFEFAEKCQLPTLEGRLYSTMRDILSKPANQQEIRAQFPDPGLKRRNNGYAIDILLETQPFIGNNTSFNFCKLIAGSEGTLAFITEAKLNLEPLPPKNKAVVCVHLNSVEEALEANLIVLKFNPGAVELMDRIILNCTRDNIAQQRNRFFLKGDPGAILIIEFARETTQELSEITERLIIELKANSYGYHFPILYGSDITKVWQLRKSGLGVLSNIPGDAKPVSVIEDTAVIPRFLPNYIKEFNQLLKRLNLRCVYHAHIGSGELHLRPVLNLKKSEDVELFRILAREVALIVKKYRGSLSGEHGDGRLRGEFIPLMIGEHNYSLLEEIKNVWDTNHIFNAGKIVYTPQMNSNLRYSQSFRQKEIKTYFDFSNTLGILRATENCNGSGDCRKSEIIGGTMCPSYMATRDEKTTTRARANILRDYLSFSNKDNPFDHKEIYEVLDLCLSCKGCKVECPSNVDMTKLKAEFLQHYYDANGIPLRTLLIGYITKLYKIASTVPAIYNFIVEKKLTSQLLKKAAGFAPQRSLPHLAMETLMQWAKKHLSQLNGSLPDSRRTVFFFIDEFTNYNDVEVGIKALKLLNRLGYSIEIPKHLESGRTFFSKGLLRKAKSIANQNVKLLKDIITENTPLIGIEPSCILTFRDEYPEIVDDNLRAPAKKLGMNALYIDEFFAKEIDKGIILKEQFTRKPADIRFHGHCQQKSLITTNCTKKILSLPENFNVSEINSGCCGMAGSFGYEKEHYALSMKIGELVLFPAVRNTASESILVAPGTSCRHHIKDGTGKLAIHPVEVLFDALI